MSDRSETSNFSRASWRELVDRYLADTATTADLAELETWFRGDASRETLRVMLDRARKLAQSGVSPVDTEEALAHLQLRMIPRRDQVLREHRQRRPAVGAVAWTAVAAAAIVAAVFFANSHTGPSRAPAAPRAYATASGSRETVRLVDGTQIVIAPQTTLYVASDYAAGHRAIVLDGEAYFRVIHDGAHPFTVQTRGVITQDVGTEFDVRAYREDPDVHVAVARGAVVVEATTPAMLSSGDMAVVTGGQLVVHHRVDVAALTAWQQGQLVFQDTPLRRVVQDLARTFDLKITVVDSTLLNRALTASVGNEPVDDVLRAVAFAVGADVERTGKAVVFRRPKTNHAHYEVFPASPLRTTRFGSSGA